MPPSDFGVPAAASPAGATGARCERVFDVACICICVHVVVRKHRFIVTHHVYSCTHNKPNHRVKVGYESRYETTVDQTRLDPRCVHVNTAHEENGHSVCVYDRPLELVLWSSYLGKKRGQAARLERASRREAQETTTQHPVQLLADPRTIDAKAAATNCVEGGVLSAKVFGPRAENWPAEGT